MKGIWFRYIPYDYIRSLIDINILLRHEKLRNNEIKKGKSLFGIKERCEMVEIEKVKEIEKTEREKIKEGIRQKKEKEKVGQFEKATVECPECKSHRLVHDYERAELICNECGLVVDADFIDQGPEWRAFDHDQRMKRSRVGAPMTYTIHDKGLSTMIDWRNRDSYGKSISSKSRAQLYRLRKWQRRIRGSNATERNLAFALSELDRMASSMGLPGNGKESAAMTDRKA